MEVRDQVWSPASNWVFDPHASPWPRVGAAVLIGFVAGRSRTVRAIARGVIVAAATALARELLTRQLA